MGSIKERLNPWLGKPKWKLNQGRATLSPNDTWNYQEGLTLIKENIIAKLPGDPWAGVPLNTVTALEEG